MKYFLLLVVALAVAGSEELPPSCNKPVYCDSDLLHHVQLARIYADSKTFVDMHLLNDEETTLNDFQDLLTETNNNPTKDQLITFVNAHFDNTSEIEDWTPSDFNAEPNFLKGIRDEKLRQFGRDVNAIWPGLGRRVTNDVFKNDHLYSLIPVYHGFIIPGGRFTELYYWDTYWIIEGLLISEMKDTVRGMLENFIDLLKQIGHIPNGSRWYYQERSQPPLLTAMTSLYIRDTQDIEFLRKNIGLLEKELQYWLDTQIVKFEKDNKEYTLLRYDARSRGPRPESYREDYNNAQYFDSEERQKEFYIDIKSAAESGWDFSSRWFSDENGDNTGNLTTIHTRDMIPVDLNAIFANALHNMAYFQGLLQNPRKAARWAYLAKQWRNSIEEVFWNEQDGIWYDYNIAAKEHRKYFYPSNFAPLWMGAVEKELIKKHATQVVEYLISSGAMDFPGGIPASLANTGEQWDFPNAWPPLVSIIINALEALDKDEAKDLAFQIAQVWVRSCYKGYTDTQHMFEKYDVTNPGKIGGGGEYNAQDGFGWTNGVVLELLAKYGRSLTAADSSGEDVSDSREYSSDSSSSLSMENSKDSQ